MDTIYHQNLKLADLRYATDQKTGKRILDLQQEFIRKFSRSDQEKIVMAHKIEYVYNTTALEGNTYNYIETETLLSGVTVGGHTIKETDEILNQQEAWEFTLNNAFAEPPAEISTGLLKDIHFRVGKDTVVAPGQYRTGRVKIGGTVYIPPKTYDEIVSSVENFFADFKKLDEPVYLKAIILHFIVALIQPFYDGNKRTARLMMNLLFLQNSYPLLSIPAKIRQQYVSAMIAGYETLNLGSLVELLSELTIKNLEEYNESRN